MDFFRFQAVFYIVSTDLRLIMSIFVAKDIFALFTKSVKNWILNVQNEGRGGQQLLNNVKKTTELVLQGITNSVLPKAQTTAQLEELSSSLKMEQGLVSASRRVQVLLLNFFLVNLVFLTSMCTEESYPATVSSKKWPRLNYQVAIRLL